MKNQNLFNAIRKNKRSKFIKSSLHKIRRARDNRWNKYNELIQDEFEPFTIGNYDEQELDMFRNIKAGSDV
jgi:hypothetical protein